MFFLPGNKQGLILNFIHLDFDAIYPLFVYIMFWVIFWCKYNLPIYLKEIIFPVGNLCKFNFRMD